MTMIKSYHLRTSISYFRTCEAWVWWYLYSLIDWKICDPKIPWAFLVVQMVKNLPEMQETQVRSLGWEVPLEKAMATHSGILAWRIPWTEEPAGLQSMGLQRAGHEWVTNTFTFKILRCLDFKLQAVGELSISEWGHSRPTSILGNLFWWCGLEEREFSPEHQIVE